MYLRLTKHHLETSGTLPTTGKYYALGKMHDRATTCNEVTQLTSHIKSLRHAKPMLMSSLKQQGKLVNSSELQTSNSRICPGFRGTMLHAKQLFNRDAPHVPRTRLAIASGGLWCCHKCRLDLFKIPARATRKNMSTRTASPRKHKHTISMRVKLSSTTLNSG